MNEQTLFLIEKTIIVLVVFFSVMLVVALTTLVESEGRRFHPGSVRSESGGALRPSPANRGRPQELPQGGDHAGCCGAALLLARARHLPGPGAGDLRRGSLRRAPPHRGLHVVEMIVADVPIGILYILALSSLGVYGVVMGGWASNNKFSFLGGLRASAQMVSYEVALGLSVVAVLMMAGNVTLTEMVWQQQQLDFWFAFPISLAFILFVISAFAETSRMPFDMPEAESELVGGFHTEYSGMKYAMYPMGEYAHMLTSSALMATLFFGGWDIPFWTGDDAFWYQGEWIRGFAADGCADRGGAGLVEDPLHLRRLRGQDLLLRDRLHLGPVDGAPVPLRPGHAARVEGHAARGPGLRHGRGGHHPGPGHAGRGLRLHLRAGPDGGQRHLRPGSSCSSWTGVAPLPGAAAEAQKRYRSESKALSVGPACRRLNPRKTRLRCHQL